MTGLPSLQLPTNGLDSYQNITQDFKSMVPDLVSLFVPTEHSNGLVGYSQCLAAGGRSPHAPRPRPNF